MPETESNQVEPPKKVTYAALYVDGFNLYHPLCELGENHLKWLNLWALGELVCADRGHKLAKVVYCTAYQGRSPDQKARHIKYNEALEDAGVTIVLGHYMTVPTDKCENCGAVGSKYNEKQTDINMALSAFADAKDDVFDVAYLLTADSDHTATARFLKQHFSHKKVITVSPPLKEISRNISNFADGKRRLNRDDIAKCRFPSIILRPNGDPIRCPREYDEPAS